MKQIWHCYIHTKCWAPVLKLTQFPALWHLDLFRQKFENYSLENPRSPREALKEKTPQHPQLIPLGHPTVKLNIGKYPLMHRTAPPAFRVLTFNTRILKINRHLKEATNMDGTKIPEIDKGKWIKDTWKIKLHISPWSFRFSVSQTRGWWAGLRCIFISTSDWSSLSHASYATFSSIIGITLASWWHKTFYSDLYTLKYCFISQYLGSMKKCLKQ